MYTSMFRKAMLGDTATLNLDFTTTGVLDSRLTFTRASTATYINSSGYVTTAEANTPRFDYDPVTLAPRGLLVEGQTQNALFYSQDITQASRWTIQGGIPSSYTSISATGGTAPDNTNTANLCTESTANNSRSIYQGLTAAAGTYTASVWVKAGTGSTRYIRLVLPSAAGNFVYVTVNISTGAVTQAAAAVGTASAASATVTPYAGSWYRIQLTGTLAAAVNFVFIVPLDSATPSVNTGDYGREAYLGNGSTFLMWGAQLEAGSGASSYIPTVASQVTRNPDYCQSTVASGIANWLTSLTTSTYFVDFVPMTQRGGFANTWNTRTSTFQGYEIYCFDGTAGVNLTCTTKISASTNVETNVATGLALNSRHKIAYSISAGSGLRSVNGSTVSAANPVALPTGTPSTFGVGSGGGGSGTSINAWIRSVKYYPTALTQTEINGMTAA